MATIFRASSRSAQRFVGLPSVEKARLWPVVDQLLVASIETPDDVSTEVVLNNLDRVLIAGIIRRRYEDVYDALGKVLGVNAPAGKSAAAADGDFPGGKSLPGREVEPARRPLAKAAIR